MLPDCISEHLIFQNFPGGHTPRPPSKLVLTYCNCRVCFAHCSDVCIQTLTDQSIIKPIKFHVVWSYWPNNVYNDYIVLWTKLMAAAEAADHEPTYFVRCFSQLTNSVLDQEIHVRVFVFLLLHRKFVDHQYHLCMYVRSSWKTSRVASIFKNGS